jgi:hypothetical protein
MLMSPAGATSVGPTVTSGTFTFASDAPLGVSGIRPTTRLAGAGLIYNAGSLPFSGTSCTDGATSSACSGKPFLLSGNTGVGSVSVPRGWEYACNLPLDN